MAEPRLALVEQHLVAVQGKLHHYEEQQQRLLKGIEQIVNELVDKAAKARGGRGAEVLQTTNALSTIFSNALLRMEEELDKRIARLPQGTVQSVATELEPRIALLEAKLAEQPVAATDLTPLHEELQHVKDIFVKELGRIHQTTFKPGDFGTPLNQLQQKVTLLEGELKTIKRTDTTQLAEATISAAIANFRKELTDALEKMVSADQLHQYKNDLKRIEETSLDAQTRSYTLLSRSTQIESYAKNLLEQFKVAASRLEQELSEEYSRLDSRLQAHFVNLCKKEFDAQADELKKTLIEQAKVQVQDIDQYLTELYSQYLQKEINKIHQQIEEPYHQYLKKYNILVKQTTQVKDELLASSKEQQDTIVQYAKNEVSTARHRIEESYHQHIKKYNTFMGQIAQVKDDLLASSKKHQDAIVQYAKNELATIRKHSEEHQDTIVKYAKNEFITARKSIEEPYQEHINKYTKLMEQLAHVKEDLLSTSEEQNIRNKHQFQEIISNLTQTQQTYHLTLIEDIKHSFVSYKADQLQQSILNQKTIEQTLSRQTIYIDSLKQELARMSQTLLQQEQNIKTLESQILRRPSEVVYRTIQHQPLSDTRKKHTGVSVYQSLTKCFYTAIFTKPGQPADTLPAIVPMEGWDYVCFTNIPSLEQRGWMIQVVDMPDKSPVISAKDYKWLSHKYLLDYDVVVWMDAYLAPNPAQESMLQQWITDMTIQKYGIGHRTHEVRDCIYDECDAVIKGKRDTPEHVTRVKQLLASANMPRHKGLFDTNIVIRFHRMAAVQQVSEAIYKQLRSVSPRDQLAVTLQYYLHKMTQLGVYPLQLAWEKRGVHVRVPAF